MGQKQETLLTHLFNMKEKIIQLATSKRTWVIVLSGILTTLNQLGVIHINVPEITGIISSLILGTKLMDISNQEELA